MTPVEENAASPAVKEKKSRTRSPNYPGIGLEDAVGKTLAIYKQDKLAASPRDAALKHMGFDKAHGEAGRVVSALKSFGLIEEVNDRIKITQRGIDIVVRPPNDEQRIDALRDAAISPEIYRQLLGEYKDGLPSDTTLKAELIAARRFNPNAVDGFINDFRGTLAFAGLSDWSEVELNSEKDEFPMQITQSEEPNAQLQRQNPDPKTAKTPPPNFKPPGGDVNLLSHSLPISIPRNLRVDVQVKGDVLNKEDLARIKSQITRWLEGLEEAFAE